MGEAPQQRLIMLQQGGCGNGQHGRAVLVDSFQRHFEHEQLALRVC